MDRIEQRLNRIVFEYWQIPVVEGRLLVTLVLKSPCARATTLRHHLVMEGMSDGDIARIFNRVVTPTFVMAMLRDLCATGSLSYGQCAVIENAVLACVNATGQWKAE